MAGLVERCGDESACDTNSQTLRTSSVRDDARIPDLMVVRGGDRDLIEEQRGYAIDRQGKAPGFVLEVAPPSTGRADYTDKCRDYEQFGVVEYWRFDPSGGEDHVDAISGDRLAGACTSPSPLNCWAKVVLADTARCWVCKCAGRKGCCGSSTQ